MNRHFIGPLTASQLKRRKRDHDRYIAFVRAGDDDAYACDGSFLQYLKWLTEKKHYVAPPAPGEYP